MSWGLGTIFEILMFPYPTSFHLMLPNQGVTRTVCRVSSSTFTFCVVGGMLTATIWAGTRWRRWVPAFQHTKYSLGDK